MRQRRARASMSSVARAVYNWKANIHAKTTVAGRYSMHKRNAKKTGKKFLLSRVEFELFCKKDCYYCGISIETIGLDRLDNEVGYIIGNVVSCCKKCNMARGLLSQREFIDLCIAISKRFR